MEAVDDRKLQRLQKGFTADDLLIIEELGFVPLSKTGAELLFEVISQRYERGSIIITSNLPFELSLSEVSFLKTVKTTPTDAAASSGGGGDVPSPLRPPYGTLR